MTFSDSLQTQSADAEPHDSREDILILVDFQNVYLPGEPWGCPTMEKTIENTLTIIHSPDSPEYVLTQYIAPENPTGCWKRYNEEYAQINADEYLCDFTDSIKQIINDENVITKNTYSSLKCAELISRLEGKKRVILTGVVAECCVLATMMDAIDMGYEVVYLYDCISGFSAENEKIMRILTESFSPVHTRVMSSSEYLQQIQRKR